MKTLVLFLFSFSLMAAPIGPQEITGTKTNPKRVNRLQITKDGVVRFYNHQNWLLKLMAMFRKMFGKLFPQAWVGIGRA